MTVRMVRLYSLLHPYGPFHRRDLVFVINPFPTTLYWDSLHSISTQLFSNQNTGGEFEQSTRAHTDIHQSYALD